jgi:hypothetical protein
LVERRWADVRDYPFVHTADRSSVSGDAAALIRKGE